MGVKRIREFNSALSRKWCWWLLTENESLWYRVLVAKYGEEGGRLVDGGRSDSAWWRVIAALWREERFDSHVGRSVGNVRHIFLVECVCWWGVF